nr:FHA domain-containing protein [uncultured Arsenicibacter sp.]
MIPRLKKFLGLVDPEPVLPASASPTAPLQAIPTDGLPAAPQKRAEVLAFIINSLHPYRDEAQADIQGLTLYICCPTAAEEELANVALYTAVPDKFKEEELNRELANHYIRLPRTWTFSIQLVHDHLPDCRFRQGNLGLQLHRTHTATGPASQAIISVLRGQANQAAYIIQPEGQTTLLIGRGFKPALPSGRIRSNDIVFLEKSDPGFDPIAGKENGSVSRSHAKITFDPTKKGFFLFAEEGGLPMSGNKTKIFRADDSVIRVDIMGMGYPLQDGDQIELGGEAALSVTLS